MCWVGGGMGGRGEGKKRGGPHHIPCGDHNNTRNDGTSASLSRCRRRGSTGRTGNLAPLDCYSCSRRDPLSRLKIFQGRRELCPRAIDVPAAALLACRVPCHAHVLVR